MRAPLVSVLIPVFNGEPFLAECLESVLAQDFDDYEVLISDDGSTDGSSEIIERFARRERRIRSWRNARNLGLGPNFNACLREARGEFLKYMLQDDKFLEPTALGQMVASFPRDDSVSLMTSASYLIDARSRFVELRNSFGKSGVRDGKQVILKCLHHNGNLIGEPSLTLFRKNQALRGFDGQFKQLLDLEMWFHLLEQGRLSFIAEPLCAFRVHPFQQTAVNRRNGLAEHEDLTLLEKYYCHPWIRSMMSSQTRFKQIYNLRHHRGERFAAMRAQLMRPMNRPTYALCWLRYKISRPFHNLHRSLQRRRLLPGAW